MRLWISTRYMTENAFIKQRGVQKCLDQLAARGHEWHLAERDAEGELIFPVEIIVQSEVPNVLLTDNDSDAAAAHHHHYIVLGFGTQGTFQNCSMIFENSEALTAGYLELEVCHAVHKPYVLKKTDDMIMRESCSTDFDELYRIFEEEGLPMFAVDNSFPAVDPSLPSSDETAFTDTARATASRASSDTAIRKKIGLNFKKMAMREAFEQYIRCQYSFYGFGIWTVIDCSNRIVGWCGFSTGHAGSPDLGYIIKKSARRKHIAWKACQTALTFARDELQLTEVMLYTDAGNTASRGLAEKLGFTMEGTNADGQLQYQMAL